MVGVLVVDKPKEMTSHDVVNIARKSLGTKRIGHTGTLDPNATGVLVLAIGKATKLVKYFEYDTKTYLCTFLLGASYDTDDVTGKLLNSKDASKIKEEEIKNALNSFLGKQEQIPPAFSAIKIQGRKMYELARRDMEMPKIGAREVEVFSIDDIEVNYLDSLVEVKATMKVSKGTYIRSFARDLGERLNSFGALKELRRLEVNKLNLDSAVTIEELKTGNVELKDPFDYLDLPKIYVDETIKSYINHGRFLDVGLFEEKTDTIIYTKDKEPLAIYFYDETKNTMRMSVKWC